MKHGVESTAPTLLAGFMVLLSIQDLFNETEIDVGQLANLPQFGIGLFRDAE